MTRLAIHIFMSGTLPVVAAFASGCAPTTQSTEVDARIGSTSLCADSYLIALAPERIGALSWQTGSPLSTADAAQAAMPRLWANRELLAITPMAVITGPGENMDGSSSALSLTWGEDFAAVTTNAKAMAAQFDLDITQFEAQLSRVSDLDKPAQPPRVLYLSRSGGSAGPGTFVDAAIRAAGGINANDTPGWHTPAIERVLQIEPDLIVTSFFSSDYAGISDRGIRHSALRRYLSARPRVEIPGKLWPCAGPGLIEATRQINAAVLSL